MVKAPFKPMLPISKEDTVMIAQTHNLTPVLIGKNGYIRFVREVGPNVVPIQWDLFWRLTVERGLWVFKAQDSDYMALLDKEKNTKYHGDLNAIA